MNTTEPKTVHTLAMQRKSNATLFFTPEESREGFLGSTQQKEPFFKPAQPIGNTPKPLNIQTKLTVGSPDDVYEQEADAMAEKVVQRMADGDQLAGGRSAVGSGARVQMKCAECEQEERLQKKEGEEEDAILPKIQKKSIFEGNDEPPGGTIQAKSDGVPSEASSDLESRLSASRGSGQALPEDTRGSMESAFGADFSSVRVHTGSEAVQMNQELGAQAFTHGSDVYFGSGKYDPGSREGNRLLGHELTHVVQQGGNETTNLATSTSLQKVPRHQVMRSLSFESTVKICHRVLKSREFQVSQGGLRVVLLLNPLDSGIPNCKDHEYGVSLTSVDDLWFDDEIGTCDGKTNENSSFSFGNVPVGTYYLTIHRVFDHPYCCIEGDILVYDEPIKDNSSGCTRDETSPPTPMQVVHGALDILGFIPALGAIPDGINAIIYVAEGDWENAGLSGIAMIPAFGDGIKLASVGGKVATKTISKTAVEIAPKTAFKLGEEGIVKAFKETKAASVAGDAAKVPNAGIGEAAKKGTKALIEISQEMKTINIGDKGWRQSLKLASKQEGIVYVLKDAQGNVLKIGKTTQKSADSRFAKYLACANKLGIVVLADIFTLEKNATRTLQSLESEVRGNFGSGKQMPWDNTGQRLGRKGSGLPPECH